MADSQPPEGLQPRALIFRALRKQFHGLGRTAWVGHSTMASDCHSCNCATDAVLAEIEASGRLLPSGGEVSTQYGVRWHATPGYGDEWDDWGFLDEAQAREEMASSPTPSTLLRRRTITLPVEPVLSDNSEKGAGDGPEA